MRPPIKPTGRDSSQERVRINHQIHLSPVRLVDPDGNQLGVVSLEEAKAKADELGLDLVEVNGNIRPIVCRIMDYGRFKYDKQKSAKKSKTAASELKQIKYRPGIDDHDFEVKTAKLRKFLSAGNKVRVTVMFRRRDMRRPENGLRVLRRVAEELADVGRAEDIPNTLMGRDATMTIFPLKAPPPKKETEQPVRQRKRTGEPEQAAAEEATTEEPATPTKE